MHVKRENEPCLLVASLSLKDRTAKQMVKIYGSPMQIEEGFRDCKSVHYGLGLLQNSHMSCERRSVLCLIASCAIFVLWCVGIAGKQTVIAKQMRVNSSSQRESYSVVFLSRRLLAQQHFRLAQKEIMGALDNIKPYMESLLCK